jgi:hypothetical protein
VTEWGEYVVIEANDAGVYEGYKVKCHLPPRFVIVEMGRKIQKFLEVAPIEDIKALWECHPLKVEQIYLSARRSDKH